MNSRLAFFSIALALSGVFVTVLMGLSSTLTSGVIYYMLFALTGAVAFTCSLLAVIFGSRSNKRKRPGKGIAIIGVVLGSLNMTYLLLLAIGMAALIFYPIRINLGGW